MKVSKDFILQEYIDRLTFAKYGDRSLWFIDARLFPIVQKLRDKFGTATINNWHTGGNRNWSGLRTKNSRYYSIYSQHSFGRAVDIIFKNATADEVRHYILQNEKLFKSMGVGAIENGVSWVHLDLRNTNNDKILIFNK